MKFAFSSILQHRVWIWMIKQQISYIPHRRASTTSPLGDSTFALQRYQVSHISPMRLWLHKCPSLSPLESSSTSLPSQVDPDLACWLCLCQKSISIWIHRSFKIILGLDSLFLVGWLHNNPEFCFSQSHYINGVENKKYWSWINYL